MMHPTTFEYLTPTDAQMKLMTEVRTHFADFAAYLTSVLPDGADKSYLLRELRDAGMWANVTITRHSDGTPRKDNV